MVVVDSSVWIANLRRHSTPQVALLRQFAVNDDLVVGDLVLAEVLVGARDEANAARIERNLRRFHVMPMAGEAASVKAARHYRTLRGRGVTIRSIVDVFVATFCLARGWPLLHQDRDFDALERHLGLPVLRG